MAKNYISNNSLEQKNEKPRKIIIKRILAFSKAYSKANKKSSITDLLKN